jgi:hypothetical protein
MRRSSRRLRSWRSGQGNHHAGCTGDTNHAVMREGETRSGMNGAYRGYEAMQALGAKISRPKATPHMRR